MQRLSDFIVHNIERIISEWEIFSQSISHDILHTDQSTRSLLKNRVKEILLFIAEDINTPQSNQQQINKSYGEKTKASFSADTAAEIYGALRLDNGFDVMQLVAEYRALRASVTRLWLKQDPAGNPEYFLELIRFNEAIDQSLTESVLRFTENLNKSKDIFIGILGHDLRNPLGAIMMSAHLIKTRGLLNETQTILASQIEESSQRINEIITELLDLTRAKLGTGIPVDKVKMNFSEVSEMIVDEMAILHPDRAFALVSARKIEGYGDPARIKQVLSNLLGNAVQYGDKDKAITVTVFTDGDAIIISVHNYGIPISSTALPTIFDSMIRSEDQYFQGTNNLGLGLYIAKTIMISHGGDISVTSNSADGIAFTATFPQQTIVCA